MMTNVDVIFDYYRTLMSQHHHHHRSHHRPRSTITWNGINVWSFVSTRCHHKRDRKFYSNKSSTLPLINQFSSISYHLLLFVIILIHLLTFTNAFAEHDSTVNSLITTTQQQNDDIELISNSTITTTTTTTTTTSITSQQLWTINANSPSSRIIEDDEDIEERQPQNASHWNYSNETNIVTATISNTIPLLNITNTFDVDGNVAQTNVDVIVGVRQTVLSLPYPLRTIATIVCVIILLFGVTGNVLVPLVVCRAKELSTGGSTNVFLVNLSIADLLILIVCMPTVLIELHSKPEVWTLGEIMCKCCKHI